MASGLAIPVGPDANGKARISVAAEQTQKIIRLHLSQNDSKNPFQSFPSWTSFVFASDSGEIAALARGRVTSLFSRLEAERKARLCPGYPKCSGISSKGDVDCEIWYIDMETDSDLPQKLAKTVGPQASPLE